MINSSASTPAQSTPSRSQSAPPKSAEQGGFSSRIDKQSAEAAHAEAAADAVRDAVEQAEQAEVFTAQMVLGDGSKEGEDEKSRKQRKAMEKRRKIALAALDALVSTDPKLTPPSQVKLQVTSAAPTITEAMLQRIVSDVYLAAQNPQQVTLQVQLKDGALKGLLFRIVQRPEGLQVIFLSDSTEIRSLLRLHADRLTKSLRDRNLVIGAIDIRDPEEDERERRHQRQREAEQELEAAHEDE